MLLLKSALHPRRRRAARAGLAAPALPRRARPPPGRPRCLDPAAGVQRAPQRL